jgi:hypothetical protein
MTVTIPSTTAMRVEMGVAGGETPRRLASRVAAGDKAELSGTAAPWVTLRL